MRQAGRYLMNIATYVTQNDFISFCLDPEQAPITLLFFHHSFWFDAAIIFSDILMVFGQ